MGTQLVTRKFLTEEENSFVSVMSNNDTGSCYVELEVNDGANSVLFGFLLLDTDSMTDEYNAAIGKLQDIHFAVNSAMDELMDSYTELNLAVNSMNEDPPWEER